jgi:hypothetical protein
MPSGSALGLADLANNLASATKGLATAVGLANAEPQFPEYTAQGITADFQREHWYKNPTQGLYSFSVNTIGDAAISELPAFDNIKSLFTDFFSNNGNFGEFKLPITPQEISQVEDFAVSIKPTQGGTVINHSGNKYKTLTISGTTGVQPFRGLLGVYKDTGLAIGKPDELKYRSGYEVFQHFRQWMRSYHETKAQPGKENLRMVFRNYKDWEFLYVEPLKFTMKRDAHKPLLYNYHIQLRVIGILTLEKPLFDLAVAKLNEISVAMVNSYVLLKKNKDITEFYTGVITDFELSLNNLKYALKAATKEDITLSEFTKSDTKKLSFKETLQVLGAVGKAMGEVATDVKTAEDSGTTAENDDPATKAQGLNFLANTPSGTNSDSAKAELNSLLDSEPGLLTKIGLDKIPAKVRQDIKLQQEAAALISRVKVAEIQKQTQEISNKLAEGLGLGDDTYNQIFGLTPTVTNVQSEVTDDQFEMLYALHLTETAIDGILSSDEMFDRNADRFKKTSASNSADSLGQGVFSFPNPNGAVKEGFVPDGLNLEEIALSELGDSTRWTEIVELNGLKPPYILSRADTLSPNYSVSGVNFTSPTQIRDLQINQFYLIPAFPIPGGAWAGKGNYLATYVGGNANTTSSWRFLYPDDGTTIQLVPTAQYFQFKNQEWTEIFKEDFLTDGVLRPGDKIKIPSSAPKPTITPIQGPRDNPYTNNLSSAERSLGVDLRLTEKLDLDLTPSGDLNVVYGVANGAQAIVLKLLYEKGALKDFPTIGTSLTPGKKIPDIATVRSDLLTSLLQDTRIKNVTKINLIQENNSISLSFEVIFNDLQQPVPITIPI